MEDSRKIDQEVREYLVHRADLHGKATQASNLGKDQDSKWYICGICQTTHHIGDLVMLYHRDTGKLGPR